MMTRTRKSIALLSAGLLFLMQAMPAVAICNCDVPAGESCCDATPPEEPEPTSGCCSMSKVEQTTSDAVMKAHGCERTVVSTDLTDAALPAPPHADFAPLADTLVPSPDTITGARGEALASPAHLRGPPAPPSVPLYLLNASILR